LVRPHPSHPDRPQLVLLDHGLYRKLDDDFRRDYCRLWQALILGNATDIEMYCRRLHAGSAFTLLAGLLTQRPWDDITSADMNR
jgi:aarF domain-containing kinase